MFSSNTSQVSADANWIEECFSTHLYTGNGSTQTITNGIDLAGKGGLTWIKARNTASATHILQDTARGISKYLYSSLTNAETSVTGYGITTFGSTGFTLVDDSNGSYGVNGSSGGTSAGNGTYASWTFRRQPKFFDVVTYTGNGVAGRAISHSLGSVPGCIILKSTSQAGSGWKVWHRAANGGQALGYLETTLAFNTTDPQNYWGNNTSYIAPTSTTFTVSNDVDFNNNGSSYVAYLFAHDAGGFGLTGTDNVISCGSYTGTGAAGSPVTLGYEPQWLMVKRANSTGSWWMYDNMRGVATGGNDAILIANSSGAEDSSADTMTFNATGFEPLSANGNVNASGSTYIYIAIRRGPMKTPTSGTSVFSPVAYTGTGATRTITAGFPVDWAIPKSRQATGNSAEAYTRLIGPGVALLTAYNFQELSRPDELTSFASNTGVVLGASTTSGGTNMSGTTYVDWNFARAPGFFDVVCYTGTGSATTQAHNLGVVPEMIIIKDRISATNWTVYTATTGTGKGIYLNSTSAEVTFSQWVTSTSSTTFGLGTGTNVNGSGDTYVAYLFASCPGVSKVGSYTGTGALQTINCGFTGGARFVLIKRTDSTGDWYVWDSARGIVSGNDPYLLLNSTAAEVTNTDYVDTYSAGFEISSTAPAAINANGGSFIFLAIA